MIFVVVLVSVVVQGGLVPTCARRGTSGCASSSRSRGRSGMRFRDEPEGLHRFVVAPARPRTARTIADLPLEEDVWVSMVSRAGRLVRVSGATVLEAGDEVLAITADAALAEGLFRSG